MRCRARRSRVEPALGVVALAAALAGPACTRTGDAASASAPPKPARTAALGPRATFPSGQVFRLEVAVTDQERAQGLMFREFLAAGTGMVFLFEEEAPHGFWMKNCHFPLDLIFLKLDGTVVDVLKNLPPCAQDPCPTYQPAGPARTVIEVNAGDAGRNGVEKGTRVRLDGVSGR